jgi:hypothetical protein
MKLDISGSQSILCFNIIFQQSLSQHQFHLSHSKKPPRTISSAIAYKKGYEILTRRAVHIQNEDIQG